MSDAKIGPIVSSSHLAEGSFPEISEFEFGLIIAGNAFHRWVARAMAATGYPELSSLDVLVLHSVYHRGRPKTLADLCLVMNIEDTHTVNYAIKKLIKSGLVKDGRRGKEKTVEATEAGVAACLRYREIRESLLLEAVHELGFEPEQISKLSTLLRLMSGQYDQAARSATAL
ncbi:winged helix DNA-binding protein [Thalassovita taeanensis]|uniref:Predicted transcription regulator, contains HTH domain, MarR family n=1 Tax=Thalassovita taeanensis TaxID=657014 RepID=A0A1H9AGA9_9RHOB|nr:winged helix DNA-binding protein [Thalassovita taeanensis]SEP75625.1 Predicted transcription regulator, contains HTH domain, MarR family [Thalassovita taeanensis]